MTCRRSSFFFFFLATTFYYSQLNLYLLNTGAASPHRFVWCLVQGTSASNVIPWQYYQNVKQVFLSCTHCFDSYSSRFLPLLFPEYFSDADRGMRVGNTCTCIKFHEAKQLRHTDGGLSCFRGALETPRGTHRTPCPIVLHIQSTKLAIQV